MRFTSEKTTRTQWWLSGGVVVWALIFTFVLDEGPHSRPAAIAITISHIGVIVVALLWLASAVAIWLVRRRRARSLR